MSLEWCHGKAGKIRKSTERISPELGTFANYLSLIENYTEHRDEVLDGNS